MTIAVLTSAVLAAACPAAAQLNPAGPGGGLFDSAPADAKSVVSIEGQFTAPSAGQPGRLLITATIKPGWHIYSITQPPGGPVATKITVSPPPGVRITGPFQPSVAPDKKQEPAFDNLTVETHHDTVTWSAPIELAAGVDPAKLKIAGKVTVQPCDPNACLPPTPIAFSASAGVRASSCRSRPPGGLPPRARASSAGGARFEADQVRAEEVVATQSTLVALLFAFGGGLILNVMPCVLPVIGLKILSFFQQAGQSRGRAFVLNLWYSLGLLSVFLVLAALGVGLSEMFTAELFGIIMAAIVFAMALNLMGVWEFEMPSFLGSGKIQALTQDEGALGAFFKGIVTTLLAIPCGAPLLSPALTGWTSRSAPARPAASIWCLP